ncbi:MAG: tetratricopeptide repeat protein [Lachnospiraceae bacterium]|nr:tetratricopeptide repeat protein [Lachnospiraceae bacterium]
MYCEHCGKQIDNDSKFCAFCGGVSTPLTTSDSTQNTPSATQPKKNHSQKKFFIIIPVVVLCIAGAVLIALLNTPAAKARKQLKMAAAYLDEMDYERAYASYELAISIDPKNPEGYLGMADCLAKQGKDEESLSILITGYQMTGDATISAQVESLVLLQMNAYEQSENYEDGLTYMDSIFEKMGEDILPKTKDAFEEKQEEMEAKQMQKEQAEAAFLSKVSYALEGDLGEYIRNAFNIAEEPAETVAWFNDIQGYKLSGEEGFWEYQSPGSLLPYTPSAWQYWDEYYMGYLSVDRMIDWIYFVSGYEYTRETLPVPTGEYSTKTIHGETYIVVWGGVGWVGGNTILSNPAITILDETTCLVTYEAHATRMAAAYASELEYEPSFDGTITFTITYDEKSEFNNLRITGASISN